MKPLTAGAGIRSTIRPSLSKPIPRTMKPQISESVVYIRIVERMRRKEEYGTYSNLWARPLVAVSVGDVGDNLRDRQGHDSHGSNTDIF